MSLDVCPRCKRGYPYGDPRALVPGRQCFDCDAEDDPAGHTADPWDHNGECRHCDEQAMHRADCPWLVALLAEYDRLRAQHGAVVVEAAARLAVRQEEIDRLTAQLQHLTILLSERQEHRAAQEDRCRVCHRLIGVGVPFLHLGICEACSGPEEG